MSDPETAVDTLSRITGIGFRLAIDDFGAGYSSLAYLKRFSIDTLKIDRQFVKDMTCEDQSHAIVRSTVQLARSLDLAAVAEGVEDEETHRALRAMGCHLAQGFLYAKPAPAAECETWLS